MASLSPSPKCQLACALTIYICVEDRISLETTTIGERIGASSGLQNVNCAGLVNHLRLTNNVYPEGGPEWAKWARDASSHPPKTEEQRIPL